MKKKKALGLLLFVLGFGLVLYPMISRTYYDIYFRAEVERLTETVKNEEFAAEMAQVYEQQVEYNQTQISRPEKIEVADVSFVEDEKEVVPTRATPDFMNEGVLGVISIPKIDLYYPIYDGATDENLYNGVARIDGTSFPVGGLNTNSVIAGHNGLAGRTYFSKIKQLVPGDLIEIQNRMEKMTYEVYHTAIIEPTETEALAVIPGQDTITLLTCTWPPPGTHRFLVYARRVENVTPEISVDAGQRPQSTTTTSPTSNAGTGKTEVAQAAPIQAAEEAERRGSFSGEISADSEVSRLQVTFKRVELVANRYGQIALVVLVGLIGLYFGFIREAE